MLEKSYFKKRKGKKKMERSNSIYKFNLKLLEIPKRYKYFKLFLEKEFSEDSLTFFHAVEDYKNIPPSSKSALLEFSKQIFDKFVDDSIPNNSVVNLNGKIVEDIKKNLSQPSPSLFNQAQDHIFKLLRLGYFFFFDFDFFTFFYFSFKIK